MTATEARARAAEVQAVLGQVEDVIVGVVGGLNAPTPALAERDARPTTAAERRV